jgi:hypothetical protein
LTTYSDLSEAEKEETETTETVAEVMIETAAAVMAKTAAMENMAAMTETMTVVAGMAGMTMTAVAGMAGMTMTAAAVTAETAAMEMTEKAVADGSRDGR